MNLLACSCLNVRVHGKGSLCDLKDTSCLRVTENVLSDPFFESHIYNIDLDLAGVTLSQKMLCKVRSIENWSITTCTCCMMDVFAKEKDNNDRVLVNSKAETNSDNIASSMNSERYSSLFKLILPEINDNFIQNNMGIQFHNRNIDISIELVQNQVSNFLKEQQKAMEERIRHFTNQQQTMYTNLLQKVRKNKQAMIYLMIQCKESQGQSESETMVENLVESTAILNRKSANASTDSAFDKSDASELPVIAPNKQSKKNVGSIFTDTSKPPRSRTKLKDKIERTTASIDVEGVFDMEEFDSKVSISSDSDNDSYGLENIQLVDGDDEIPSTLSMCASSLPVSIPAFACSSRSLIDDSGDKDLQPLDPEDIAASMKALACSVKDGTEMFGELPRRRLNTGDLLAFRLR